MLGTNLTKLLLEKGYTVRALVRNTHSFTIPSHERLHLIHGSLSDNLSPHLKDVNTIIHVAATCRQDLLKYSDYYQTNCASTKNLLDAAIRMKVRKFIFVSTANTIGYGLDQSEINPEQKPMKAPFTKSFYAQSKAAAETCLLQYKDKIEVNIINPTFIIGAYDSKPGSGKIVLMSLKNRILFYPPGGKNFVTAGDVCTIIEKCIRNGENGRRYLAIGENLSYAQFFKQLKSLHGQRQWLIPAPSFTLVALGLAGDLLRYFNIKTNLCSNNMSMLLSKTFYATSSALTQLKISGQPIRSALVESIQFFRAHHLKKSN